MAAAQQLLPVQNIRDDVIITKDGTMSIVLQTSSINFGLLSENEQLAIISSFAGFLNSLSFVIQIVIRSRKLDISDYIARLDEAQKLQTNQLLSAMMGHYRNFIKETIKENEVLDKQFYVVVSVSYLEAGISRNIEDNYDKALTILIPRRDHVLRQMARIGLKTVQLNTNELVSLFYDIYNETPPPVSGFLTEDPNVNLNHPQVKQPIEVTLAPALQIPLKLPQEVDVPKETSASNPSPAATIPVPSPAPLTDKSVNKPPSWRNVPFVIEELGDDYGTI